MSAPAADPTNRDNVLRTADSCPLSEPQPLAQHAHSQHFPDGQ